VTTLSTEMTKEYTDTLFSFQKHFISWAKIFTFRSFLCLGFGKLKGQGNLYVLLFSVYR
jgi:hypothetical protein